MITDAKESNKSVLLTSKNCSNPLFWGKDLKYVVDGQIVDPSLGVQIQAPQEFDFFNAWCGKDPINAKKYFMDITTR